jgi:hypothetical protein
MKKLIKKQWREWVKSSVFTFLTVALPLFVTDLKALDYASLEQIGFWAAGAVVLRLAMKAVWYGVVALFVFLSTKFTAKK